MNYTLTFPIYRCPFYAVYRAKLNQKIILVLKSSKEHAEQIKKEALFLQSLNNQYFPSILSITQNQDCIDLVIENGVEWLLNTSQYDEEAALATIFQAYIAYSKLPNDRDCMIENLLKHGDNVIVMDFGLKWKQFQNFRNSSLTVLITIYEIYWSPEVLFTQGIPSHYQWNLGVMLLAILYGQISITNLKKMILDSLKSKSSPDIKTYLSDVLISKNIFPQTKQFIEELLDYSSPLPWNQIINHKVFQNHKRCIYLVQQQQKQLKRKFEQNLNVQQQIMVKSQKKQTEIKSLNPSPNISLCQKTQNSDTSKQGLSNNCYNPKIIQNNELSFQKQNNNTDQNLKHLTLNNSSIVQKSQLCYESHKEKIRNSILFKSTLSQSPQAKQSNMITQIKINMRKKQLPAQMLQEKEDLYYVKQDRGRILKKKGNLIQQNHICDLSLSLKVINQEQNNSLIEENKTEIIPKVETQKKIVFERQKSVNQEEQQQEENLNLVDSKYQKHFKLYDSQYESDNQSLSTQKPTFKHCQYGRFNQKNSKKEFVTQYTNQQEGTPTSQQYLEESNQLTTPKNYQANYTDDWDSQKQKTFIKTFTSELENKKSLTKKLELSIYAKQHQDKIKKIESLEVSSSMSSPLIMHYEKGKNDKQNSQNKSKQTELENEYLIQSPPIIGTRSKQQSFQNETQLAQNIQKDYVNQDISPYFRESNSNQLNYQQQLKINDNVAKTDQSIEITKFEQIQSECDVQQLDSVQTNEIPVKNFFKNELVVEDLENSIELHKKKIELKKQQKESDSESSKVDIKIKLENSEQQLSDQIEDLEQYSYTSKSSKITKFQEDITYVLECINLVGTSAVKCMEYLNAVQNFWIIPLFLVFKRMYQLRVEIEDMLKQKQNMNAYEDWEQIIESDFYQELIKKVKQENQVVYTELNQLLSVARKKCARLEKSRQNKVDWFLNEDPKQEINDTMFVYFCQQVYIHIIGQIKQQSTKQKIVEWWRLTIEVQGAILVTGNEIFNYDEVDFNGIQRMLQCDNIKELEMYHQEKEQRVFELKQKLIKKGYKL